MIHYENMTKDRIISLLKDTLEYAEEKDKEIERLNNIIKQQDTRNSRQRIANRKLLERNQDLVIENLKLNNIINEIYTFLSQYTITHTWQKVVIEDTIKYIDELKGSE